MTDTMTPFPSCLLGMTRRGAARRREAYQIPPADRSGGLGVRENATDEDVTVLLRVQGRFEVIEPE